MGSGGRGGGWPSMVPNGSNDGGSEVKVTLGGGRMCVDCTLGGCEWVLEGTTLVCSVWVL